MDDYGNCYQTDSWLYGCEEYAYSANPYGGFGVLDELCFVGYRAEI